RQLAHDGFDRANDVAFDHEVQLLDRTGLHLLEEPFERDTRRPLLGQLLAAQAIAANIREIASTPLVLDDASELTGGGRLVEPQDLDWIARLRLLELLAAEVVERAHLAPGVTGDDRVANAQRAAVDQHGRDRAPADVQARFDDRP